MQLRDLLLASGFTTNQVTIDPALWVDWRFPLETGLELSIGRKQQQPLTFANEICIAFMAAKVWYKIKVREEEEGQTLPGMLQISVWPKPLE